MSVLGMEVIEFWRRRREVQVLVPLMLLFLFLQAALGALAVVFDPTPPEILAAHFGVSLLSFVSILLVAIFLFEEKTTDRLRDDRVGPGGHALDRGRVTRAGRPVGSGHRPARRRRALQRKARPRRGRPHCGLIVIRQGPAASTRTFVKRNGGSTS